MIDSLYDCFKHWSKSGSVYILSDPHFNDNDCLTMDENWLPTDQYVEKLNKMIFKTDTLICLGDCGDLEYFNRLKVGYKVLIKGNHDDKGNSKYKPYFDEVYDGALFISDKILLSHEPIYGLPFCLNIHGHNHGGIKHNGYEIMTDTLGNRHLNLASNVCNFTPINLGKLIKMGALSDISNIHRVTIDKAVERKKWREENNASYEDGYKMFG